ncbi:MAG: nucleotidyl transferase AbiEii/AbiGii toxin family protein, partial [Acidimicrobiia bacterium]
FRFEIGAGRDISAEGPEGGLRFPVLARLDGRQFERFTLDVNLLPGDTRPVEEVALRNLFEFAGFDAVVVPMIPAGQQLAEKLHAYTRDYGEASSRAKDLHDMLVVALELPLPDRRSLLDVARETFRLRRTEWPPDVLPPPADWTAAWSGFVATSALPWKTLDEAFAALEAFWGPVCAGGAGQERWDGETWSWR